MQELPDVCMYDVASGAIRQENSRRHRKLPNICETGRFCLSYGISNSIRIYGFFRFLLRNAILKIQELRDVYMYDVASGAIRQESSRRHRKLPNISKTGHICLSYGISNSIRIYGFFRSLLRNAILKIQELRDLYMYDVASGVIRWEISHRQRKLPNICETGHFCLSYGISNSIRIYGFFRFLLRNAILKIQELRDVYMYDVASGVIRLEISHRHRKLTNICETGNFCLSYGISNSIRIYGYFRFYTETQY